MTSPYSDLDRPPLSAGRLRADLRPFFDLQVVPATGSTQADVAALARAGAAEGAVVVAEHQRAGRGRLGRSWTAPPRAGLSLSVLLRPERVEPERWGWLPLLGGLAVLDAVRALTDVPAVLKWPNDVLTADGGKLAGVLAERVGDAVVLGLGVNVSARADELAGLPGATSLVLAGARHADRGPLLRALLRALADRYQLWEEWAGRPPADYLQNCSTIGRRVRLDLPGGHAVTGTATGVDDDGRLLVHRDGDPAGAAEPFSAGQVRHLRPAGADGA